MAAKPIVTPELLRQLLDCDPETGLLTWRRRSADLFRVTPARTKEHACANWNARYAGKEAFTSVDGRGYRQGAIFDRLYPAARVIWAIETGEWPSGMIDHINGNVSDNRMSNLREADYSENARNQGVRRNNTSGFKGVCWHGETQKWRARIVHQGRAQHLGYFDTETAAAQAYDAAAQHTHGKFARVNFPRRQSHVSR